MPFIQRNAVKLIFFLDNTTISLINIQKVLILMPALTINSVQVLRNIDYKYEIWKDYPQRDAFF